MSVHSHSAHSQPAAPSGGAAPAYPRHVVTAVLVSHDGARWLPQALAGLTGQERPVQNVVAADTGSADESAALLTETLGADRVLHLARRSGFGTAVDEAVRTAGVLTPDDLPYLKRPSGWDPETRTWRDDAYDMPELPHGEPVQWLWLLHDDCAPEPDALAELLRVADSSPSTAIIGPKLRGWYDRRQLLEAGVSIARSGRRWTGLDRREQDQGQHDQVRPVLSVSTAGMLIRRDVWDELGGFDRRLPLMRDDVDLCWRAQAAGHQVLIAPEAVLRHAEAAARERRPIDCAGRSAANPHRVDKAGAVYTMLVNSRGAALPYVLLRLMFGTVLRTLAYLVGKVPGQALDEIAGLLGVLLRPGRLLAGRRRRGRPVVQPADLRPLFPPPGATVRATAEAVIGNFSGRSEPELASGGRHGAVESGPGGDDADFLEIEQFARLKRVARKPGPVLFLLLLAVSLVACRGLLGSGTLAGGALLPAPADASALWDRYLSAWQPVGTGGTEAAPPYLAVIAALSTLLLGSTGAALTLLLVCSVPLAGLSAYFASRPLVGSRLLRAWAAVAYAFLPAATGALAGGRLGTAVLAVLLPLMARAAVAAGGLALPADRDRNRDGAEDGAGTPGARPSWRALWAYTLLLTFTTAFTPVVWPLTLLLGIALLVTRTVRHQGGTAVYGARLALVLVTPLVILAPWSLSLLASPSGFLREVGLAHGTGSAGALDLLMISPGGPKAAGGLLLAGLVLAALAALLRDDRQRAVRTAWAVAIAALLLAAVSNGSAWAGPATLVYGIALLSAAAVGAEDARERVAAQSFGWRQPVAALIALAAAAGPLLSAVAWMYGGAAGPLERRDPVQVPPFVAEESRTQDQARTLVLGGEPGRVSYTLVRGSGAQLGDADLAAASGGDIRLDGIVANLVAGSGADQTDQLGGYAVRYILVRDGAPRETRRVLDTTPGLTRLSQEDGSSLWRLDRRVARVTVVNPGGGVGTAGNAEPVPVAAGPVEAHTSVPAGPEGRVLRVADRAAPGWTATLDGKPLTPTTVDEWAQGFELPASGGRLDLTYASPLSHTLWTGAQGLLAVVLVVLALPGRRREVDDDLPETGPEPAVPAQPVDGEGRRARRLRAAAEAEAAGQGTEPDAPRERAVPAGTAPGAAAGDDPFEAFDAFRAAQAAESADRTAATAPGAPSGPYADGVPQQPYGTWGQQSHAPEGGQPYPGQPYQGGAHQSEDGQQYQGYGDGQHQQYQQYQQYGTGPYADPYQPDPYQAGGYGDGQQQYGGQQYAGQQYEGQQQYNGRQSDPYGYPAQPYAAGGRPAPSETVHGDDGEPAPHRDGSDQQ
ncbi:glycosyltransferase family 2 protein [Streptomyces sp. F63]|uniref:glycosyltransferase family 2 protein n=1 Tax=Streptomyces sp. F63 TaxID=2824887 RepID=UPI001B375933|nr:glycosyltransferase family 2 protein [Streptomyces sp. F63]MBQ0987213.1 glycosyltransferase family 2 protein [Streptomyces sp. F63]